MKGNRAQRGERQALLDEASALEWRQQVADLRTNLARFTDEDDPHQVQRVQQGLLRLARDLVGGSDFLRPAHEVDWPALKASLAALAERATPTAKPATFKIHPDANAKRGIHVEGERPREGLIQPRTLNMLFDRYGLVGTPMTYEQLGDKYEYAGHQRARDIVVRSAIRPLQRNRHLMTLLLRSPSHNPQR